MPPILALPKRFALMAVPLAVLAAFAIVPQVHGQQGVGEFESSDEVRAAVSSGEYADLLPPPDSQSRRLLDDIAVVNRQVEEQARLGRGLGAMLQAAIP